MLAVVAGTAQVEQGANYHARARGVRNAGAVPGTAGAGQRRVPAGAPGQGARGAAARVVRCASRRALRKPALPLACSIPTSAAHGCCRSTAPQDGGAALEVKRATDLPRDATLDARGFGAELQRLIGEFRDVTVAEFLLTSIEAEGSADPPSSLRTTVRYDIVGGGTKTYRVEHVGEWDMRWRRGALGLAGGSLGGRRRIWSAARDARHSPRSPRRRSDASTRSAASSPSISTRGWRRSTRCSRVTRTVITGSRWATPTEMDSTICTSRSRLDCPTVCIAIAATPPSRTSRPTPALPSSTTRHSRSLPTSTTTAIRISSSRRRPACCSSSTTARAGSRPRRTPSDSRSRFRAC